MEKGFLTMASIATQIPENEKIWLAFKVKFKCEKLADKLLREKKIHSYLPIQKSIRRYGARVRTSEVPLINNYIFVRINRSEYVSVLETPYIFGVVFTGDQLTRVSEDEIALLERLTGAEVKQLNRLDNDFKVGEPIRIIAGKLTGMAGVIVEIRNSKKMVIQLKSLGLDFLVELPKDAVYQ